MRWIIALVVPAALIAADARSAELLDSATDRVRLAVGKSLPLLLKGAEGHSANRDCFACHNQTIPIMALTTAGDRGLCRKTREPQQAARAHRAFSR